MKNDEFISPLEDFAFKRKPRLRGVKINFLTLVDRRETNKSLENRKTLVLQRHS